MGEAHAGKEPILVQRCTAKPHTTRAEKYAANGSKIMSFKDTFDTVTK
jgi:hypothetical protein